MDHIYRLHNRIQHYDWGDTGLIPRFLGKDNPGEEPWAELWMGIHPGAPSEAKGREQSLSLKDLIEGHGGTLLGEEAYARFGTLPFLYKVLAAGRPVSIQAHPNLEQARQGWKRENAEGLPPGAPNRNYKDPNHKPEILCALTPFRAMCGFRKREEIKQRLRALNAPVLEGILPCLEDNSENGLRDFLRALLSLDAEKRAGLTDYTGKALPGLSREYPQYRIEWELISSLIHFYPGDPGIIAPLYLNTFDLEAGQAIFVPAGILHAYAQGLGIELMANSDNVLRGGLTSKHVDVPELLRILSFSPFMPEILCPPGKEEALYTYRGKCDEFALSVITGTGKDESFAPRGPSIILISGGECSLSYGSGESCSLRKGESAFLASPEAGKAYVLKGNFTAHIAETGLASL